MINIKKNNKTTTGLDNININYYLNERNKFLKWEKQKEDNLCVRRLDAKLEKRTTAVPKSGRVASLGCRDRQKRFVLKK